MAEVGVSVVAKLAEYLVEPTVRQLQYLFCVGKITRNVEIRKEELILKQGRVQDRVQEANNRTERIDDSVNKWKSDVKILIAELENLEEELKANNGCLRVWRPTWRRYCLCKKLAKTTERMIDLNTKSDCFNPFSHSVIIPDIEYPTSQNFKLFNATKMAFDQLWKAVNDDCSFMIGLWGMGGAGKTTLVEEVGMKAKESQLFDRVVLVTISQSPNITEKQHEIADKLQIKLEEQSVIGRAKRIKLLLQSRERILIILDDVWTKRDIEDIGIPSGGNYQRSCKVVLTTRLSNMCTLMDCQKMIQLGLLDKVEAWTLFQTYANVGDDAKVVAQEIAMECKGLPIAIVALGTCLKGKGVEEMNGMLSKLRNAKLNNMVHEDVRNAFRCLELSYDYLATPEAKLLLLICAMFPEDHNIHVEDLFAYGVGLGLCRNVDSFEAARGEVRTTINYLIESSLLMDNSSKSNVHAQQYVKLHDMVRDIALWIASKEHRTIMVNCIEKIVDEEVNDCYAFSSWYNNNRLLQFPSQLNAPKLKFLLLHSSEHLDISHATFEGTKGLQALIIMGTRWGSKIELQPQSIQHLSNLRTLRLQDWNLRDISFVVSLTRLEILDLQGSEFATVPDGIEKLSKLKLLDLSRCRIDECCYKVIGKCSQLEELYVSKHFSHPRNTNCYEYLGGLTTLIKLRRYNLEIGEHGGGLVFHTEGTRYLCLSQLNTYMLGEIIKDLAQRATIIRLYEFKGGSNNFMANIVQAIGSMNELTKLCLQRCSEIECITDETTPHEAAIVPRLDDLVLEDMDNLKQLHRGPSSFSLFQKLERLSIFKCPQLLNIFPANCNLGNLKFLFIIKCPMLTSLFPVSTTCTLLSLEELKIEGCNELKHVLDEEVGGDTWENSRFLKLKTLSVVGCRKLESVCTTFLSLRFVQLQHLSVRNAPQMKFVFAGEQLMHDQDETQIVLPLLEFLRLECLPSLVRICSERDRPCCPSIKTIKWKDCPNMELLELYVHQWRNEEYKPLAAIERIQLHNCGVESIFHCQTGLEEHVPTFQCLKELTLTNCARLKFVFSAHICQNFPELTSVTISCCEELEAIFLGNEETQKNLPITESFLLKLKSLGISKCNKLKFVLSFMISSATSMLPQLSTLNISACFEMEKVFKCSNIEHHDIDSDREITFPNMKSIELNNLPRFTYICQGFKFHTGELGKVKIHDCPKLMPIESATIDWTKKRLERAYVLKYSQINDNEALNLLPSVLVAGELDIQSPRVEHKWQIIGDDDQEETNNSGMLRSERLMLGGLVHTQVMSFQYLHSLELTHCKKLKFLFSKSTIVHNSLPKLEFLTLSDCEELEEIIAENEGLQMTSNVQVGFPELRELTVERCNKLKRLFSASTTTILSQLNFLWIAEADQLEVIFEHSSKDDAMYSETIVFSNLRKIELIDLPNFMGVCQGLQIQVELRDIRIRDCPKFIDSSFGTALQQLGSISELQKLQGHQLRNEEYKPLAAVERIQLDNCGVESIFHYQTGFEEQIPTFQYLKELTLKKCARLKYVFSAYICQSLPELTTLTISCCEGLEAIFSKNEETLINLSITESYMLKLKSLKISECNKLNFILSFMISAATSMFPQLSTLTVSDCSQMEEIFKRSDIEDHNNDNEREIKFPNMKHMELNNLPILVNICQRFKFYTGELGRVQIHDCPKFMPIKSATIDCTKERLVRQYELKYSQLNNKEALNLPLSVLNVGELDIQSPRVEDHCWKIISDDDQEETDISELLRSEQQKGVVPTQLLNFQYLHSLKVTDNKKLKFLFSMSTIVQNSLPKLTSLTLSDCEELDVIFGHSGDDDANYGDTIVLSSLKMIQLKNLPNLKSVCLVGLQIQVELTHINICNCPKFVDSSLGSALQQLGTLSVSTEDSNIETSSNVNEEKGTILISRAEYLWLEDSMNLISVWEGPTFIKFQNLWMLHVIKCRRLKCIFPSTVMRSLPCLFYLVIEECEELEEIMSSGEEEHNHFPNESSNYSFCFPQQLQSLTVMRCRKLKWLFPSLPSFLLPHLDSLRIEECCQLKGLCNSEVEIHEEGFYNNSLPKLTFFTVEDCPMFSETTLAALESCQRRDLRRRE